MKEKILPVEMPIITHTPPIANLFSILGTNSATTSWIMNYFTNIYIHKDGIFDNFYDRNMFFYGCPWIQIIQMKREIIENICGNINDYIKTLLDMDFYVYTVGNTEYIPAYHQDTYRAHNFMIYGYDDTANQFYIADFFTNGKYEYKKCTYEQLELAMRTAQVNRYFVNFTYGMKLKNIEYEFEIDLLAEMLVDHLNSVNLFCKYRTRQDEEFYSYKGGNSYNYFSYAEMRNLYHFGISYYDKLTTMIENASIRLNRPFALSLDHKILMKKRLDFLLQNNYITKTNFEELIKLCEHMIELASFEKIAYVKYSIYPSNKLLNRIKDINIEIKNSDIIFTEKLISAIKRM